MVSIGLKLKMTHFGDSMSKVVKICIADDEEQIRKRLAQAIDLIETDIKFEISDFGDGQEALDELKKNQYDILITDLSMPGLKGNELIKCLMDLGEGVLPPHIMVISGYISNVGPDYKTMGNVTFMPKPINMAEIEEYILEKVG